MPFSPKTMENFSSGHHKIEEELPIFPQKPSKRWKKSRWPPSESIYFFFQEIEKFHAHAGNFHLLTKYQTLCEHPAPAAG
jgi:hypothetical protein